MRWLFKKKNEKEKSQPHPILYHILEVLNFKKHQKKPYTGIPSGT